MTQEVGLETVFVRGSPRVQEELSSIMKFETEDGKRIWISESGGNAVPKVNTIVTGVISLTT